MSQLKTEPGKMEINLNKGFSLYAVIKVEPQKHKGRKVIFQIKQEIGSFVLTIGLDEKDDLKMWITDFLGIEFNSESIPKNLFFNKFVFLTASIASNNQEEGTSIIGIGVDDYFQQRKISANLGTSSPAQLSIGATIEGNENAAFQLAELMLYESIQSQEEKNKLRTYVKTKYAI
jgi:hypothetical protein